MYMYMYSTHQRQLNKCTRVTRISHACSLALYFVVEKVNADYEGSRKEFWAFIGRRTKSKKKIIHVHVGSLRSDNGVLVTSTRGMLHLGRMSEDVI